MSDSPITTTLVAIRAQTPCEDGWQKLLKRLGKTKADDEPLRFSTIIESNGIDDALWCLLALPEEHQPRVRRLAADFAERVLHIFETQYPDDDRPRKAIQAARDYADGKNDDAAMAAAGSAARAAAMAAAWAAAWAADRSAAWDAERKSQGELLTKYFG